MMRKESKNYEEDYVNVTFNDDGGAAKSDGRRIRRMRRRWAQPIFLFLGCILLMILYIGGRRRSIARDEAMKNSRMRRPRQMNVGMQRDEMDDLLLRTHKEMQHERKRRSDDDDDQTGNHGAYKRHNSIDGHNGEYMRRGKHQMKARGDDDKSIADNVEYGKADDIGKDNGEFMHRGKHQMKRRGDDDDDNAVQKMPENDAFGGDDDNDENDTNDNNNGKYRWINPRVLPPVPGMEGENYIKQSVAKHELKRNHQMHKDRQFVAEHFKVRRADQPPMEWEAEADDEMIAEDNTGPVLDYTKHAYSYPDLLTSPPNGGEYPPLETMADIYKRWPQDEIDEPPATIVERLLHFDYSNPEEMEVAIKFRNAELPFKVYNVPELDAANLKWTDEYVASNFNERRNKGMKRKKNMVDGGAEESPDNFFAFFVPKAWNVETMGPPPTKDNDWNYETWAKHARYADKVQLPFNEPHYYWQAGIPPEERLRPKDTWTFISRDLPSFSNPQPTFFGFDPSQQKGIQCRFGERGVTAATHYDTGRNMVAMITGAKRYVLAPPKECSKLGIVTSKMHPSHRHSLLNFGHINLLDDPDAESMPEEERGWLEVASESLAIDTVLKAGEVLYIPSHWFHYITSLQKSAQCNTRSGVPEYPNPIFGGFLDVDKCEVNDEQYIQM